MASRILIHYITRRTDCIRLAYKSPQFMETIQWQEKCG